ncbi:hypothetical protein CCS41_06330 [Candidatus Fukatsuia symbiotica]|uniref:Uncharacterized protein n=1 Tax=Candidatus Fukatsuia symbiotica TaxID=1878942 RepID=A0A2U8I4W5_9GAMM|nr:hypothetical protein CCS41_06330 [Candidatus Fukatsuia symbiotica]
MNIYIKSAVKWTIATMILTGISHASPDRSTESSNSVKNNFSPPLMRKTCTPGNTCQKRENSWEEQLQKMKKLKDRRELELYWASMEPGNGCR